LNPLVEFCVSNLAMGAQSVYEALEKDPNVEVLEYGCLSFCTRCSESLYAVVEGDVVEGATPEELLKNIYTAINNNPMFSASEF